MTIPQLLARLRAILRSPDALDGAIMASASLISGLFAYLVLVVASLLLPESETIAFLAVMNLLKIAEQILWVMRNVMAYYTAELAIGAEAKPRMAAFFRQRWRWVWGWGSLACAMFVVAIPWLAQLINVPDRLALLAAAAALLLLIIRPITDGALQGSQQFKGLAAVTILQELLRFLLTGLFIWMGWQLAGAVLALPVASLLALGLALWWLWPIVRQRQADYRQKVSWPYSMLTLLGLGSFALLVYSDAILINRLFPAAVAMQYTPANILGRLNLFVPVALGMVLFPKVTQRHALGQDARPYLLLALLATLGPGFLLTAVYFAWPGPLVALIFRGQYADPGSLLGWVGLAVTLFAGVNIWLNYALAVRARPYVVCLALIVVGQMAAIVFGADSLAEVTAVMVIAGLAANVAGLLFAWRWPTTAV